MTTKFFLKREDALQHGAQPVITIATHLPRVLSIGDARTLAVELVSLTNPWVNSAEFERMLKMPAPVRAAGPDDTQEMPAPAAEPQA